VLLPRSIHHYLRLAIQQRLEGRVLHVFGESYFEERVMLAAQVFPQVGQKLGLSAGLLPEQKHMPVSADEHLDQFACCFHLLAHKKRGSVQLHHWLLHPPERTLRTVELKLAEGKRLAAVELDLYLLEQLALELLGLVGTQR
jgi:hypothetical protein